MTAPRPAATVALLRDGPAGLETYLLRRNPELEFAPGASVFPGGAVDEDDRRSDWDGWCDGPDDRVATDELGLRSGGLSYRIAAVRECFEEVGVLLGGGAGADRSRDLRGLCAEDGVVLATASLRYFGHWITPMGAPRRYDTRFFFAECPGDQTPEPDRGEALEGAWLRPAAALAEAEAGERELILPTERTLRALAALGSVEAVLTAVRPALDTARRSAVADAGGVRVRLPGDPGPGD